MTEKRIIRVACFGLQGFGNDLVESLQNYPGVEIVAIHTRKPRHPFAYYPCETMETLAARIGAPLLDVPASGEWDCRPADLALVSSFHRLFRDAHLRCYRHVVNLHPSLLPRHKGATPTNWAVKNGETIVGMTAHLIDAGQDTGAILFQRHLLNPWLADCQLRKALAFLSRQLVADVVRAYPNFTAIPQSGPNSSEPPRTEADAVLEIDRIPDVETLIHHIKAFTNYPMPKVRMNGRLFTIDYDAPRESLEIRVQGQPFHLLGYWLD